jgi:chemotaxis protein histidine kinase CheA
MAGPRALLAVALAGLLACANASLLQSVFAQATSGASNPSGAPLTISTSFADKQQIAPDAQIELRLSRALGKADGRLAVVIKQTDVTNLFTSLETVLRYNPQLLPLPLGESELTVYLVSPKDQWQEIARFTLHVSNEKSAEPEAKASGEAKADQSHPEPKAIEPEKQPDAEKKPEAEPKPAAENQAPVPEQPEKTAAPPPPQSEQKSEAKPQASAEAAKPQADAAKSQAEAAPQADGAKPQADTAAPADGAKPADSAKPADDAKPADGAPQTTDAQKPAQKRLGFEKLDFTPALVINIKSQPAQSNFPEATRPERPTFTDLTLQASMKSEMTRGMFSSQTQFDFVGSSFQKEALRFGQLGDQAPQVDLSSYLMQFQTGKVKVQTGHYSFGTNRHLINSFSSRGLMMSLPLGTHGDFALTAMNGSSIVGFDNFFGLDKRKHQLLSGTLGLEFLPKRPGGLRFEASLLDGWLLPITGVTQGSVNDAERSRGIGFRVIASDPKQRFKLDTGFTRSEFVNPADPLLNQNAKVKDIPVITRNAHYLDASVDILKDFALTKTRKINLTFALKHELVDPLFRSLGASTQADKVSNDFSLVSAIGEITAQFTHARFNDNLANVPSILKSLTRANTFTLGVPLASLFSDPAKPSPLFPRVAYNFNRTHQFGAAIPVNGGFELDPTSIPDQLGTVQAFTADWQIDKWKFGYRLNHSLQNNQQPGKELADLVNFVNGFAVGVAASKSLDLNVEINHESTQNIEAQTIDRTLRLAPTINWRMSKKSTFASNFSVTLAGDEAQTKRNRNLEFDMQWTFQFGFEKDKFRKLNGQFFIRYANRFALARNTLALQNDLQKTQIVNIGISFNIF